MRTGVAILTFALVAGLCPASAADEAPFSKVENKTALPWTLTMRNFVAGRISIRKPGAKTELASLSGEGHSFRLDSGQAIEIGILPVKKSLALGVTLGMTGGSMTAASIFFSQGMPKDPPTLNINATPLVHVDKAAFGKAKSGTFILLQ